jgi:parvulin-like peptidyl-prolyl isomerase
MMRDLGKSIVLMIATLGLILAGQNASAQTTKLSGRRGDDPPVARVDGQPILRSELELMFKTRRVEPALQPKVRDEFLDQLIDARLIQRFLTAQKINIDDNELNNQVAEVKALLPKSEAGKLDLQELGLTEKTLRDELALPLKWRNYVTQTVPEEAVQKYFQEHRIDLDGTEVKASQIFVKVADLKDPQQVTTALAKLSKIRQEIEAGLPFADAAKKYSQALSREKGGDVGYFLTEGKMPRAFTKIAFNLKPGQMSEPFVSPFGAHLCLVTDRKEGEASLEDVRPKVMEAISRELQAKKVKELRTKAKIERL